MRTTRSFHGHLPLLLGLAIVAAPDTAHADSDVLATWGGKWRLSTNGTGGWEVINSSTVTVADLRAADFDGNCRADLFTTWGGKWRVSLNGTASWEVLNTSDLTVSDLRFADFNGDGKTDVFTTWGGKWRVSFSGTGGWQVLNTSDVPVSDLRLADFDGDGKTDVFAAWGGKWRVSFGGTGGWQVLNASDVGVAALRFADFNADGDADVFAAWGGKWRVSFGGTSGWQTLNSSNVGVAALRFADFDGDDKADVFTTWDGQWRVSFGGTGGWTVINTSSVGVADLLLADFNGDGSKSDPEAHVCLRIARFTTSALTNSEADTIVQKMTTVLRTDDGAGDVACPVTFKRKGSVKTFATGDGSIDSSAEFTAVLAVPGHVKVVDEINFCSEFNPSIIGCAPTPGNSLIVERFSNSQEGILWAHEYGHTRGLPHRNDSNAVMNGSIAPSRTRVNTTECEAFQR